MTLKKEFEILQKGSGQLNSSVRKISHGGSSNVKDDSGNSYKMRVIHLIHDDKFFDSTIDTFRYLGVDSTFVLLCKTITNLKYIQTVDIVKQIEIDSSHYDRLIQEIDTYDLVWIHYLDEIKAKFVNKIPQSAKVKVFWSSWGGDYIDLFGYSKLRFRSWIIWFKMLSFRGKVSALIKGLLAILGVRVKFRHQQLFNALKKVDFFSTVLASEESLVRRIIGAKPQYRYYVYKRLPPSLVDYPRCDVNAKRIWLGNSATYSNHHFDVLPLLKDKTDWTIIAPLSYGNQSLINKVNGYASELLGNRWIPLLNFMPYKDFMHEMRKASVFVFDMFRQQAIGNINLALRIGGCVFLNKENPVYSELCNCGIKVYATEDLKRRFFNCIKEFEQYREKNIQRMQEVYHPMHIEARLRNTMRVLDEELSKEYR